MKGTLKYYEPDSEINYPGGWAVQDKGDIINVRTYLPCKKSLNWIENNNLPKEMEVEFEVIPECYFSETENKGYHKFVAKIDFNGIEKTKYPIGGFAPGNHIFRCITCKYAFFGDKRAVQCEACAIEMVKTNITEKENGGVEILNDYLPGFIDQFGDGPLGELDPEEWGALDFLRWLEINNYKIVKK